MWRFVGRRIKPGLGKKEFSTGLTSVTLLRVRTSDGIMIVDRLDFFELGGKHLQHRFDDYARRNIGSSATKSSAK